MRILMAANVSRSIPSGIQQQIQNMAREMRTLGHEVHCLFAEDVVLSLTSYSHRRWFGIIEFPILLVKKIMSLERERRHFDIVDITGKEGYLFGLLRKLLCTESKYVFRFMDPTLKVAPKVSEYYRDYYGRGFGDCENPWRPKVWFSYLSQKQDRITFLENDRIIVMCKEDASFLMNTAKLDQSKIALVPLSVSSDVSEFTRDKSSVTGDLLFVGRCTGMWGELEGIRYLADAFPTVVRRFPEITLTIIGCSDVDEVTQFFPSEVRGNLIIHPFVPRQQLIRAYAEHKILIHSSLSEGFGMIFLEGMAAGLAVIATPVGGAADICEDRTDSILVPCRDSDSLAKAIIFLLENENVRKSIGRRAREKAKSYTWKQTAIKTLKVYEDTLAKG